MRNVSVDIYSLLVEADRGKRIDRSEMLRSLGVAREYFDWGRLTIDKAACRGVECKLCIKACPTSALYWDEAQVKVEADLCIHCSACVLSCIVDNCITLTRRRGGVEERFSTPRQAAAVNNASAGRRRAEAVLKLAEAVERSELRRIRLGVGFGKI
jgi:ferredoxin